MAFSSAGPDVDANEMKGAGSRREFLAGLRARAVERMRAEEQAANVSSVLAVPTRRDSLRWMGFAALAGAAGLSPLRASGARVGALAARSEGVGSGRVPAPQYGVPGFPEPTVPFEPMGGESSRVHGKVFTAVDRRELGKAGNWVKEYAVVIPADGTVTSGFSPGAVETRVIEYELRSGEKQTLEAISDAGSGMVYIVPGGHDFYVEDAGEMWGFLFSGESLTIRRSYLRMKRGDGGLDAAIGVFAEKVKDKELEKAAKDAPQIATGYLARRGGGWGFIWRVRAQDGVADIQLAGGGMGVHLRVDWKNAKLVE